MDRMSKPAFGLPRLRRPDDRDGSNCEILKRNIVLPGFPRQRTFAKFLGWFGARLSGRPWHRKTAAPGRSAKSQSVACSRELARRRRGIIAPRRSNIAHLHRPWRATLRFCAILLPIGAQPPH
jgi:hypothetical protein